MAATPEAHKVELKLKKIRISFPHLFIPRAAVEGSAEKFGASFLIPNDDPQVKKIRDAIKEVAKLAFDGEKPDRISIQSGDKKFPGDENYAGMTVINAYSWTRPVVIDNEMVALSADVHGQSDLIHPGCYVNAHLMVYPYTAGGDGIAFGLEGVQWVGDGESLGIKKSAASMFEEVEAEEVEEVEEAEDEAEEDDYEW